MLYPLIYLLAAAFLMGAASSTVFFSLLIGAVEDNRGTGRFFRRIAYLVLIAGLYLGYLGLN